MTTIVAEIGICHNGDMARLKELIFRAKECGADIAKTQLYSPAELFPDKIVLARGKNWYPEVEKTELTKEKWFQFVEWCKEAEIEPLASAFDFERLEWLEEAGVKRHKVATRMNQDVSYIGRLLDTGKEILLSCQPHTIPTVFSSRINLLYCIPEYPAPIESFHLSSIPFVAPLSYGRQFHGLSDHSRGIQVAQVAISRGAQLVEKHFTLDRNDSSGPDHLCSAEPQELRELVKFARQVPEILEGS